MHNHPAANHWILRMLTPKYTKIEYSLKLVSLMTEMKIAPGSENDHIYTEICTSFAAVTASSGSTADKKRVFFKATSCVNDLLSIFSSQSIYTVRSFMQRRNSGVRLVRRKLKSNFDGKHHHEKEINQIFGERSRSITDLSENLTGISEKLSHGKV
jgi:hypothetical protein